jgi:NAD(P)-dependent dehydrogenase (short-subunit alcohol dehydrogenase family)
MKDKRQMSALYPDGFALVIGGSGGVGSAICRELVNNDVPVVLTYNSNRARAEALVEALSGVRAFVSCEQACLQDLATIESAVNRGIAAYSRLHSVFIATGYDIPQSPISEVTPDLWQRVMRSDAEGAFNAIHATLPHLRSGGGGSYVHISSAGLLKYPPLDILSVAPKAAVEELIKGVAKEEGVNNIRANSIAIGVIETGIFLRLKEQGVFDDAWIEGVKTALPLNRFGQPEEVAKMAVFLASNNAAYTTGQLIPVDGGFGV